MSGDALVPYVAARDAARATLVGTGAARAAVRRRRRRAALAVRAEAVAAVDAGRARISVLATGIESGECAMIAGAELLPGQVERRMARVGGVRAVRGDIDRGPP